MDIKLLERSPLFINMKSEEIEKVLSSVPYRVKKFPSGSLVAQCGDEVRSLMMIIQGVVKGEMIDFSGKVVKIENIHAPGALASAFLFGNKNLFPVNVVTITDTDILIIEKQNLLRLLMKQDRILINFLNMISNRSQFLSEKIMFLSFKTIKGKLAQFILERTGKDRSDVELELTRNDIADFFGVARPSVSRALKNMEDEGLIEVHGKNIKITDRKRLSEINED